MTQQSRQVFTYRVDADGERDVVSMLDPDWVFQHGLCIEAILGFVQEGASVEDMTPAMFRENPAFLRFLSRVIYEGIGAVEGLRLQAAAQKDGYVYLLDARTPDPGGRVAPEDIIGAVRVDAGAVVEGSYQHSPRHRLLTANGFFGLPEELEKALDQKLRARSAGSPNSLA